MKRIIYFLGIFTGLIIMVYGLKRFDDSIHDIARCVAGFVLIASHAIVLGLMLYKKQKDNDLEEKVLDGELKLRLSKTETQAKELAQTLCKHDFPYEYSDCNCTGCGILHSKVNEKVKPEV